MNTFTVVSIIAGLLLLLVGRKGFWFFLGLAGIAFAITFIPRYFPDLSQQTLLIVSIVAGVAGGALAFALAKVLVWVGGFVGGGYLGIIVWQIVGGILGMLIAKLLFESVLVVASSAMGAALLVHLCGFEGTLGLVALVVLTAVGIIVQGKLWPRSSPHASQQEKGE
jgi:hypothetical protein